MCRVPASTENPENTANHTYNLPSNILATIPWHACLHTRLPLNKNTRHDYSTRLACTSWLYRGSGQYHCWDCPQWGQHASYRYCQGNGRENKFTSEGIPIHRLLSYTWEIIVPFHLCVKYRPNSCTTNLIVNTKVTRSKKIVGQPKNVRKCYTFLIIQLYQQQSTLQKFRILILWPHLHWTACITLSAY